jgi:hypothetical protein
MDRLTQQTADCMEEALRAIARDIRSSERPRREEVA